MSPSRLIPAGLAALVLGSLAPVARAQTTAFNDAFAGASTVNASPSSPLGATVTAASYQQIAAKVYSPAPPVITAGNLRFGIVSTSSGFNHVQALFTQYPVTLVNTGDFIELTAVFSTEGGIITAQANSTIFFGLFNAGQVQPIPGGIANSTAAVAGYAQAWQGYVNRLFYTGGANGFYTRPAKLATDASNQDVLYNYGGGVQTGSTATSTLPVFVANDTYTEVYRITRASATTLTLASTLYAGATATGTPVYTQTATSTSILTAVYDAFAIGWRATGSVASAMNVKSVKITTTGTTTIIPEIITQPLTMTKMVGESVNLTVVADGGPGTTLTYQWKKGGVDIGGALSATHTIASATLGDAGDYTVVVTDVAGSTTSAVAALTVTSGAVAPSIITDPAGATILVGGSHTFTVAANGTAPLTYLWHKSIDAGANYAPIGSATSNSYAVTTATLADAGLYRVVVTNGQGSATSAAATLAVNQAPSISAQPAGATLALGGAHTLTVTASGTPAPTYQWRKNGVTIGGATTSSHAIASATGADAGNYTVVVSNAVGSVTSAAASVAVLSASMATTAVTPVSAATGLNPDTRLTITFNEAVSSGVSGVLRIHDAADDSVVDTIDMVAATTLRDTLRASSTLSTQLLPVQTKAIGGIPNNFNYYPITISGSTATIHPRNGVLATNKTYYVRIEPGVFVNAAGESFAGIADATTWRFATKAAGPTPGATSLTVAADGSGDFNTLQAALDFIPANNTVPTTIRLKNGTYFEEIGFQSKHFVTILGEDVDQTIIAYPNNNTFNNVSGVYHRSTLVAQSVHDFTIANLTIRNTTPQNGSQAEAIVINGSSATTGRNLVTRCKFTSYQDTVQFNKQTYISDCVIEGDVDFMWGDGPSFFENCDIRILRTGGYFTQIRNSSSNHGYVFRHCRFTAPAAITGTYLGRIDPAGYPYSEVVLLDSTIGDATNNALLATTTGVSGSNYLAGWWLLNNVGSAASATNMRNWASTLLDGVGAALVNPNADTFTTMPTDATTQANYRDVTWVLNTNMAGTANGTWTPALAPVIVTQPASVAATAGNAATFTVAVVGVPAATYQWYKDTVAIPSATNATYTIATTATGDAGGYTVTVTNSAGTATSNAATLTVNGAAVPPAILTQPSSVTAALGAQVDFTVSASGTAPLSYLWHKDGSPIGGATAATYTIGSTALTHAGSYTVVVTNSAGTATSNAATLTVKVTGASAPSGYAAAVTGGAAGTTVTVTTAADLRSYAESVNAHTVIVSGTIDLGLNGRIKMKSNKTLKGDDINATILGTIEISNAENVIVSNLNISANTGDPSTNDGITIGASTRVLVTKCTIYDSTDGNLDVVNGSDLVTISWCKFYYTRNNGHNFSNLVGSSDTDIGAGDGLTNYRVTWHHNWWAAGAMQRMIACRFGSAHMFNNYWNCAGNDYCTESRNVASVFSEYNNYDGVKNPLGKRTALPNDVGLLMTIGNVFNACTGNQQVGADSVFTPPYSYTLTAGASVPTLVMAGAGNVATDAPVGSSASITGPASAVTAGGNAALTAAPSGFTPVSYQWRFKNQTIAGATSATLNLSDVQALNAGAYTVVLGQPGGDAVVSEPFTLAVNAAPVTNAWFAGTLGSAGSSFSMFVPGGSGQASFFACDPASGLFVANEHVVVATDGTFSFAVTVGTTAATLSGQVTATAITGAISGTSLTLSGSRATGSTTPGIYRLAIQGEHDGHSFVVIDPSGTARSYVQDNGAIDCGQGPSSGAGQWTLAMHSGRSMAFAISGGAASATLSGGTGGSVTMTGLPQATAPARTIVNLSGRGFLNGNANPVIGGFVVTGTQPVSVLIRAAGPSLVPFGVTEALANPRLLLLDSARTQIASNDDWQSQSNAAEIAAATTAAGAFAFANGSADAALLTTLQPGLYFGMALGAADTDTGITLVEIYDASGTPDASRVVRLANVSDRAWVEPGVRGLVGGFVITGNYPKRVVLRGVGPALGGFGVASPLPDPILTVHRRVGDVEVLVATNDDWSSADAARKSAAFTEVGAFALTTGSLDAAIVITLEPGVYTTMLSAKTGQAGNALVEIYEADTE